jgi:hypothetical protein
MDESEIRSEMRLWALEVLSVNLLAMLCALDPKPDDLFEKIRAQIIDGARHRTFPTDASTSDLLSAELEDAVTRMMGMANSQMRASRPYSK